MADAGAAQPGLAALERRLLGGPRRYTRREVAERAGVDIDHARHLWRALGFADVDDDDVVFTDRDVAALSSVEELVARGVVDRDTQAAMTRAMGQALARLAEWQVAAVTTALGDASADPETAAAAATELLPVMESLLGYVWRRHLDAAAMRTFGRQSGTVERRLAVGFGDLVGFTALTRHVDEQRLASLVEQFESIAADAVAAGGGRVVKTVGDEVMFVADEAAQAADISLALLARLAAVDELPEVRIGVAYGEVLARLGDVYGEPVNIASRLTSVARPGAVLVDRELAAALEGNAAYRLRRVPPRPVRGYTLLHAYRLRGPDGEAAD